MSQIPQSGRLWMGRFRWVICGILLLGTTKNYMDRQVLGVLKTTLQHQFGWSEIDYGNLVVAFQVAYATGMLAVGRLIDRVGTRAGYAVAMVFWSAASIAHGFAGSLTGFVFARSALGFGEAGVFPASIKTVAEWFPPKERALATGIFNAGANLGAIVTPIMVPWITVRYGWRQAFVITGALGLVWVIAWLMFYRKPEDHPLCSTAELEYIRGGDAPSSARIPWSSLLGQRQTWAFAAGKFLTDPIWWFYLFWIPGFLQRAHGLDLTRLGLPIVVIYLVSDVGSIGGGWLSSWLLQRGFSLNASRKLAMFLCAISVTPVMFAYRTSGLWQTVLLIGVAAAGHQGFSANLFALTSDMFPRGAVASVVGIGGMAGAVGGMLIAKIVGYVLDRTGSYWIPFLTAASAYLAALGIIHVLSPRLQPVEIAAAENSSGRVG